MKKLLTLVILLVLALNCSAWTIEHYSRKIYDWSPMEFVHVTLTNTDDNETRDCFSDSQGLCEFTIVTEGNYSFNAVKSGYQDENTTVYINASDTYTSYLSRDSTSLIQLNFNDLTYYKHEFCYYTEDNEQYGCYTENDTIWLSPNHNYTVMPKLNMMEQAGFINNRSFLIQISIFIIVGGVILVFITVLFFFSLFVGRKMLRK